MSKMHNGVTPLHLAVNRGDVASILLLIEAGADIKAVTTDGQTVLSNALNYSPEIVPLLRAHGANLVHVRPDGKRFYDTPPASTEATPAPTDQVNAPADPNANAPR